MRKHSHCPESSIVNTVVYVFPDLILWNTNLPRILYFFNKTMSYCVYFKTYIFQLTMSILTFQKYEGGFLYFSLKGTWKKVRRKSLWSDLISCSLRASWACLVVQTVKNLPAIQETWVQSLGREDPLEKGTTHSSIPVCRTPWTEEPEGLQDMTESLTHS